LRDKAKEFHLPGNKIYMDGNSLGAMPLAVIDRLQDVLKREWAEELIHSWNDNDWFVLPGKIGDKIGRLIGASDGEVMVSDCVSVNIFKAVMAALRLQKGRLKIVTELGNFPTNLYVLQGIEKMLDGKVELVAVERNDVLNSINDETAIVVLTHVHYKSSEVFDMAHYTDAAHSRGALILWDLCHSAGVMPMNIAELDVDMVVGCGYKYLNGGPGAPAFVSMAKRLQSRMEQPVSGWWSHADPFQFNDARTGIYSSVTGILPEAGNCFTY
jgi:kynureninase